MLVVQGLFIESCVYSHNGKKKYVFLMSVNAEPEDPVIILTPGSETIALDPLPGLPTQQPATPTTPAASASESMRQTASNAVLEAVKISLVNWKDDRFKTVRPFGEFFDRSRLSLPKVEAKLFLPDRSAYRSFQQNEKQS